MNYKNILVAIDLYDEYEQVVDSAMEFAKKNNAKVRIVTCIIDLNSTEFMFMSGNFKKNQEESIIRKLDLIKNKLNEEYNSNIDYEIISGKPSHEIPLYADNGSYDLIAIGSHGKHGLNLLLGSTANSILHRAKCDVLTIRVHDKSSPVCDYKNILIATDLEPDSQAIADRAKSIANLYQTNMDVVNVHGNPTMFVHAVNVHVDPSMLAGVHGVFPLDVKEDIQKNFENWLKNNNIDATIHIVSGNTAQQVIDTANNIQCNLIIVGSHERGAIGRLFLGSTANAILHETKNDVLVVKV